MNNLLLQGIQPPAWGQTNFGVPQPGPSTLSADLYLRIGNLSLSSVDVALLLLCPLCAALGGVSILRFKKAGKSE